MWVWPLAAVWARGAEMRPPYAHLPTDWAAQAAQHVVRQQNADAARAAAIHINTPPPVYSVAEPIERPEKLPAHSASRFRAAAVQARTRYPGVVGDVLAEHLLFHVDSGWLGDPKGRAARLASHLLDQDRT